MRDGHETGESPGSKSISMHEDSAAFDDVSSMLTNLVRAALARAAERQAAAMDDGAAHALRMKMPDELCELLQLRGTNPRTIVSVEFFPLYAHAEFTSQEAYGRCFDVLDNKQPFREAMRALAEWLCASPV